VRAPASLQLVTADRKPRPEDSARPALPVEPLVPAATAPTAQITAAVNEHQLLIDGHQQMLEAHQGFLSAQIEGQRAFTETMMRIQNSLFGESPAMASPVVAPAINQASVGASTVVQPVSIQANENNVVPITALVNELPKDLSKELHVRPGPSFTRQQLEILAGGKISSVLGELFEQQDGYDVQVRMPEPPLLLCDRVLGIEGEAGSMGTGTIWTETDVSDDKWYLHQGRMPPGIYI
ncbi:MAG: hypothetical protein ACE1Y4_10980, partial [Lysobacterales bacterium]